MRQVVTIHWSDWLAADSPELNLNHVLYIYATRDVILYVGKAGKSKVVQRAQDHERDGVVAWINSVKKYRGKWSVKVGVPQVEDALWTPLPLLDQLESLLIYRELERDHVVANKKFPSEAAACAAPLSIQNVGSYAPLQSRYANERRSWLKVLLFGG